MPSARADELRAGTAKVDITPPAGFALWGYAARKDLPSVGVHDPLLARVVVLAVGKDGTVITGRRLNEDTYSVQIMDDRERLQSVLKSDLKEFTVIKTSTMPSYAQTFSADERADVIAYLLSLKGL